MNRYMPGSGTLCLSRGCLYVIGEFGGVSASCLLNGVLGRDVSRNVSMCSITRLAFSPTLNTYTGYTGFTATWMKYLPHGNRPRCYYRRASTTCRSEFHLLRIYFVLSSFSRIPRIQSISPLYEFQNFRIFSLYLIVEILKYQNSTALNTLDISQIQVSNYKIFVCVCLICERYLDNLKQYRFFPRI